MTAPPCRPRAALPADFPAFAALFLELETGDPVPSEEAFASDLAPRTLVADAGGRVVGYVTFQILRETVYVRNVATAPEVRRSGIGRALMEAVAARGREAGCTAWCLNVKPGNVPAIRLYESLGMRRRYRSVALRLAWERVAGVAPAEAHVIAAAEDDASEAAAALEPGTLADARARGGRVLLAATDAAGLAGVAVFDPTFPGAFPFAPLRPSIALPLLAAMKPWARPEDTTVGVVLEDRPAAVDALLSAGATLHLELDHRKGPL